MYEYKKSSKLMEEKKKLIEKRQEARKIKESRLSDEEMISKWLINNSPTKIGKEVSDLDLAMGNKMLFNGE